jgi:hypothetical protein
MYLKNELMRILIIKMLLIYTQMNLIFRKNICEFWRIKNKL